MRQGLVPATYNGLSGEDVGQIFFTQNLDLHYKNGGDLFIYINNNVKNTLHYLLKQYNKGMTQLQQIGQTIKECRLAKNLRMEDLHNPL